MAENELRHSAGEFPDEKYSRIAIALSNALEEGRKEHENLREAMLILAKPSELID
ncbi:MAG: hypothetical protein QXR44_03425 [Thermoproteota archaeon]